MRLKELARLAGDALLDILAVAGQRTGSLDRPVQGIKDAASDPSPDKLKPEAKREGNEAPDQATDGGGHKGAKDGPVVGVEAVLEEHEACALVRVAVVRGAKDEDGKEPAERANDKLEAPPEPKLGHQPETQDGDGGGGDEVRDEEDLQDGGGLEGEDDDGDDDEDDEGANVPDVEAVAEEVVGGGGDHGGLERVKGGDAEGDDHDEDDADDPAGELLEEDEEGEGAGLRGVAGPGPRPGGDEARGADEGEDAEGDDGGDGDGDAQVLVRLGGEGAEPKVGEEKVIGEDGDGEDVEELPAEEAPLCEAGGVDEFGFNLRLDANGDGGDDDEADDHGALDDVGEERDLEAAEGGVDCGDGALDNDDGQAVEAGEGGDDLADGGELGDHVEEEGDEGEEAEEEHARGAEALPGPLGEDEAVGAFAADDGAEVAKDEQGQGGGEGVDDDALDAGDGGQLRVGEEDAGTEGWGLLVLIRMPLAGDGIARGRMKGGTLERQHVSHASINLIEYHGIISALLLRQRASPR